MWLKRERSGECELTVKRNRPALLDSITKSRLISPYLKCFCMNTSDTFSCPSEEIIHPRSKSPSLVTVWSGFSLKSVSIWNPIIKIKCSPRYYRNHYRQDRHSFYSVGAQFQVGNRSNLVVNLSMHWMKLFQNGLPVKFAYLHHVRTIIRWLPEPCAPCRICSGIMYRQFKNQNLNRIGILFCSDCNFDKLFARDYLHWTRQPYTDINSNITTTNNSK